MNDSLNEIRKDLTAIDNDVLELLNKRAKLAVKVAEIKKKNDLATYCPDREMKILKSIVEKNTGPLPDEQVQHVFRQVMTACLEIQKPLSVAFLGPQGTYSEMAAQKHFGLGVESKLQKSIGDVFKAVETKEVDFGIVPIENSTTGMINSSVDLLLDSTVLICAEVTLPINHQLMRHKEAQGDIKCIYAHQQTLMQCQHWLSTYYPNTETIAIASNSLAAKTAADDPTTAAIAGEGAANIYDLEISKSNVQDDNRNTTRFVVIGRQKIGVSGNDKTTVAITSPHSPGALLGLLQPFAKHGLNITLIESRPYWHRQWRYIFLLDIDGHQDDDNMQKALSALQKEPIMLSIVGSYPKAIEENK